MIEAINLLDEVCYYLQLLKKYQSGKIGPEEFKKSFDNQAGDILEKAKKAQQLIIDKEDDNDE